MSSYPLKKINSWKQILLKFPDSKHLYHNFYIYIYFHILSHSFYRLQIIKSYS